MLRGLLAPSIGQLAEDAWRSASREQLQQVTARAAALDPEKALAASALLAFAAAGKAPELPGLRSARLGWLYVASAADLQEWARDAVEASPSAARILFGGLSEALDAHESLQKACHGG